MLKAGVSIIDISPREGIEMSGYPHCPRPNIGVHDPLYAAALYLDDGEKQIVWVTLDLLYFGKPFTKQIRSRFPGLQIMLTTSHTHSGPWSSTPWASEYEDGSDNDPEYCAFLLDCIEKIIKEAMANTFDAKLGTEIGCCGREQGVGGNRRHPEDVQDPTVNVLAVKDMADKVRAVLLGYALHPTYLHAESLVVTADYPGYIRNYLKWTTPDAVFMFAQGTSGNQSSRYFRTGQTFEEACRVGTTIGVEVYHCLERMEYSSDIKINYVTRNIELPIRSFPTLEVAEKNMEEARRVFRETDDSDYIRKRNAELTMFGAENEYAYAKYEKIHGTLETEEMPCEVGVVTIGDTMIFALQGEIFVEFGLQLKEASTSKKAFVFECTNGALSGYICTPESLAEGGYEVGTSLYTPEAGAVVIKNMLELMNELN